MSRSRRPNVDRHVWRDKRLFVLDVERNPAEPDAPHGELPLGLAVATPEHGEVWFPLPRPSGLFLDPAEALLRRADRLARQLPKQVRVVGGQRAFSDANLVLDFFSVAVAGVTLVYTGVQNFALELIPPTMTYDDGKTVRDRDQLERRTGVTTLLTVVAAQASDQPDVSIAQPDLWAEFLVLKSLRDDAVHAKAATSVTQDPATSLYARLLAAAPLSRFVTVAEAIMSHYRPLGSRIPVTISSTPPTP